MSEFAKVRKLVLPGNLISATNQLARRARFVAVDGLVGGWTVEDSVIFARELKRIGVDLVDCSSGGIAGSATAVRLPRNFGFQVTFAQQVRKEAGIGTIAVGLIVDPKMANDIIAKGKADIVALGREALVEPNWPHLATRSLTGLPEYGRWPKQSRLVARTTRSITRQFAALVLLGSRCVFGISKSSAGGRAQCAHPPA